MKKFIIITISVIFNFPLISSPQSDKLCQCLKEGRESSDKTKKNRCLTLQEDLVAELGEGSPQHKLFKEEVNICEREIIKASIAPTKEPKSFEEKVKIICDCATNSKGDKKERMKCIMLQDQYSKSLPPTSDDRINFNNQTNNCF